MSRTSERSRARTRQNTSICLDPESKQAAVAWFGGPGAGKGCVAPAVARCARVVRARGDVGEPDLAARRRSIVRLTPLQVASLRVAPMSIVLRRRGGSSALPASPTAGELAPELRAIRLPGFHEESAVRVIMKSLLRIRRIRPAMQSTPHAHAPPYDRGLLPARSAPARSVPRSRERGTVCGAGPWCPADTPPQPARVYGSVGAATHACSWQATG